VEEILKIQKKLKIWVILGLALGIVSLPLFTDLYFIRVASMIGIFVILTVGLNILVGYTGLVSLGHAAFYAIGAYGTGILTTSWGLSFWIALPLSVALATLLGILLGIPTIKASGIYLAVITICFGLIVQLLILNLDSITNGARGIYNVPRPSLGGQWKFTSEVSFFYLVVFFVILTILSASLIIRSRIGRAFMAIRENEVAAASMGIPTTYYKVMAFAISSFYAGLAGCLYAPLMRYINPDAFNIGVSIDMLIMTVIGGLASIPGSVLGGIAVYVLPEYLRFMKEYYRIVFGVGLIVMMIFMREGIISIIDRAFLGIANRLARKSGE
jgi:branched-chain amino acid transport system permease protein